MLLVEYKNSLTASRPENPVHRKGKHTNRISAELLEFVHQGFHPLRKQLDDTASWYADQDHPPWNWW